MNDVVVHDASQKNSQRTNIFNSTSMKYYLLTIIIIEFTELTLPEPAALAGSHKSKRPPCSSKGRLSN